MELSSKGSPELRAMWRTALEYPRDASRVAGAVAWMLPALFLASIGYARRWVTKDAIIDLRVVQHILAGHGPVFNIGERVEAYTSPLWVALLAAWGVLGGSPEVGCVVLGLLLSVVGLLLAQEGAWSLASRLIGGMDSALAGPRAHCSSPEGYEHQGRVLNGIRPRRECVRADV